MHNDVPSLCVGRKRSSIYSCDRVKLQVIYLLSLLLLLIVKFILNDFGVFFCCIRVKFPKEVKWLCLEFDPRSCTAQSEDSLQLYIPNYRDYSDDDNKHVVTTPYIPVLKKFSNDPMEWPFAAVMLPGI